MKFRPKRFVNTIAILAIMMTLFLGLTVTATANEQIQEPVALADYIYRCYDSTNPGFGDMPGYGSTLESTLDAVELLMVETDPITWSNSMMWALDSIVERYAGMQSPYRYGFVHPDNNNFEPDPKTTALALETLSLLGRLDAISLKGVSTYLNSSGDGISKYGLEINRWATEGDFEFKYWLLRAAKAIDGAVTNDGIVINSLAELGITPLGLKYVLAPDVNVADFDLPEPYLVWGGIDTT